jgi:hypothetical protein
MINLQLDFLEGSTNYLDGIDSSLIQFAIIDIRNKPITIALVHKNRAYIDRVTIHDKDFRAQNTQRLSYNNNLEILRKQKENNIYGRANLPGQSIFYGALKTPEISLNRATAFMETTSMVKDLSISEKYFTVSRWKLREDLKVFECVFQSEENSNSGVSTSKESQTEFLHKLTKNEDLKTDAFRQLSFFSDQFSKYIDRGNPKQYMITAFFSDMIFNHPENKNLEICGISYPSVQSELKGQNIALLPQAVDKFLYFEQAVVMKAERQADGGIIIEKSLENAEVIDEHGNLNWK